MRVIEHKYAATTFKNGTKISVSSPEGQVLFEHNIRNVEKYKQEKALREFLIGFVKAYERGVWESMVEDL